MTHPVRTIRTFLDTRPQLADALGIVALALLVRILMLPWAQTVHADAVSRVHIAYEWMLDPHYIKDGYWGPLHHYLNALFMWIFPGKVLGPTLLGILCAAFTALPVHGFTYNLFGSRRGAAIAAVLYAFAPIVFWTSLQPLSEPVYGLFLALSIHQLSRIPTRGRSAALYAGLFITCAAALRYEAWVVIALLTLVTLLLHEWRITAVFWAAAMLFPGTWMIGNQLEFGDFLYSVNQNDVWNMGKEGINDEVTAVVRVQRLVFFGWSLMLNCSPVLVLLTVVAIGRGAVQRTLTRDQLVWLIPFVAMAVVFQRKAWDGSLMLHHRFLVTWLVLFAPYVALVLRPGRALLLRTTVVVVALASVIPMTFYWDKIKYLEKLGEGDLGKAMDDLALGYYRELEIVPRLQGNDTQLLVDLINDRSQPGEGLLVDFHGWDKSYYILLHALPNTMVVGGAKHEEYKSEEVNTFFHERRRGHVVVTPTGKLKDHARLSGDTLLFDGVNAVVRATPVLQLTGMRVFAYETVADQQDTTSQPTVAARPVYPGGKDAEYYELLIRSNERWFNTVRRQAFWDGLPVDTMVRRNVDYMLAQDALQ